MKLQLISIRLMLLSALCIPFTAIAQNSSPGFWYFGLHAGLDFNHPSPIPELGALNNLTIDAWEGVATQCSEYGELLFYADHNHIWDRDHNLVFGSLDGYWSGTQTVTSVKHPTMPNTYYLFTIAGPHLGNNFSYTTVDVDPVTFNVTVSNINMPITLPSGYNGIMEGLTVIGHSNGTDSWIIVRGYTSHPAFTGHPTTELLVYSLSGTTPPAFTGSITPLNIDGDKGAIMASPDGTMVTASGTDWWPMQSFNFTYLLDFNPTTGSLTPNLTIPRGNYGTCFSPNSQVLYLSDPGSVSPATPQHIYQYDLTAANPLTTELLVDTVPELESFLQLGPDDKIYLSLVGNDHLAMIETPNYLNSSSTSNECGYDYNGPDLKTASGQNIECNIGLPTVIANLPTPCGVMADFSANEVSCGLEFTDLSKPNIYSDITDWQWNFGDGTSSNEQNPVHYYTQPGTYHVYLSVTGFNGTECCTDVTYQEIQVECSETCELIPDFTTTVNTTTCTYDFQGTIVSANRNVMGWHWDFGDGNTGTGKQASHTYVYNGTYDVCLTIIGDDTHFGGGCCTGTVCRQVTVTCGLPKRGAQEQRIADHINARSECPGLLVYPNPGNGIYSVEVHLEETAPSALIEVIDPLGGTLHRQQVSNGTTSIVDLLGHPAGIYILRMTTGGQQCMQKLVKE